MALARFTFTAQDTSGNAIAGAAITVRERIEDEPLAVIYEDEDAEIQLTNGAFISDANGKVTFCVVGGFYDIYADGVKIVENVGIGTAQGYDISQVQALASLGALTFRGAYDVSESYALYDMVTHDGSSWIYTAADPTDGNAPPSLPDVANAYWQLAARKAPGGSALSIDAHGLHADRDNHADEETGFVYLSTDGDPNATPVIAESVAFILLQPGTPPTWSDPIVMQGPKGDVGAVPAFQLKFTSSTADADSDDGSWHVDDAVFGSAENLFIDDVAQSGADISAWTQGFKAGDELHLTHVLDPQVEARWQVTGVPVAQTGYTKVPATLISSSGTFTAGDVFALGVDFIGPAGSVNTADFLKPDVTNTLAVGFTHTPYDHGTQLSGSQTITPLPSLGQKQKVTMAAGSNLTITPPSLEEGDCTLRIVNEAVTAALDLSAFDMVFTGDAYSVTSGRMYNLYVESLDGVTTCLLRAVNE